MGRAAQSIAQQARNKLGVIARTEPAQVEAARRELAAARLEQAIREAVSSATAPTPAARQRLALLLTAGDGDGS